VSHKNKLEFLRIINSQKTEAKKEVGIRLDGLSRSLLANPKASYAFSDVSGILEDAKKEMNTLNDRIFDGFSKSFLGLLGVGGSDISLDAGSSGTDSGLILEVESLRKQNQQLQTEIVQLRTSSSGRSSVSSDQIIDLQKQLAKTQIDLEKRDFEIQKLQIQLSSAKGSDSSQVYAQQLTKLKSDMDMVAQQRDALEGNVRRLESTLKNSENDIRQLRDELTRKDREIDSLVSKLAEIQELQNQNEELKNAVIKAGDKIKQLTRDMDNFKEDAEREILRSHESAKHEIISIQKDLDSIKRTLDETIEEKELLLIDAAESTQAIEYYKQEATNYTNQIKSMQSEIDGLTQQLQMFMASQSLGSSPQSNVLSMLDNIMSEDSSSTNLGDLTSQINQISAEREVANQEVQKLTEELSRLNSEVNEQTRKIKRLTVENETLNSEVVNLQSELDLEIERRQKTLESSTQLKKERSELLTKIDDKNIEIDDLTKKIDDIKRDFERKQRGTTDLDQQLSELSKERDELQASIDTFKTAIKKLESEKRELQETVSNLEEDHSLIEQRLDTARKELTLEIKAKEQISRELDSANRELAEFKIKLESLSHEGEDRSKLMETISQYRVKEANLNNRIIELETKLTTLSSELDLKEKQIEVHVNRSKELNNGINSMKIEIEELTKARDAAETEASEKQFEFERLSRQVSNFEKEKEKAEREAARAKEELEDTLRQQLEFTEKIEESERKTDKCRTDLNKEKRVNDFFRRELERLPKYVILFVLNEVRKATLTELQRTIHRPQLWVKREIQSLVQEGWVKEISEEEVEIIKDFPPV
jgi:chromosome segregation ATPase